MSQENVETARRSFELWLSGDLDAWVDTLDPNVGWDISTHPLPDVPNQGRGRDALLTDVLATYASGWNDYSAELTELIDAGDRVVAVLHETAKMRQTEVPLDRDLVQLWTVRDGRLTFLRVFRTKTEALEAAGLAASPMSPESVEIMRRFFDAFERDGLDGVLRQLHPEIEWTTTGAFLEAATYRGHEEVRAYLGSMLSEFENLRVMPEELLAAGDQAVTSWRFSGQGKQSGAAVELTLTSVSSLRDGKIVRIRNYRNKAEALEAVGLRE